MKDFLHYTDAGTDLSNQLMNGILDDYYFKCNNNANYKGFSWIKGNHINNPTASQPYVTYVRQ
jgi:hypothetical protein